MNVTPDSFSDGGKHLTTDDLARTLEGWGAVDGIDIGAESTAPMNRSITADVERERLQAVLPLLKSWPKGVTLSLDTYRAETADWFFSQVAADIPCVWNDVSGIVDEAVISVLKKHPKLRYVLCFNTSPQRDVGSEHMKHVTAGPIVPVARDFFRRQFETLLKNDLFSRTMADPCFGFAKTREQNHELLQQLPLLMEELACPQWVWGVSRKSFMRFPESLNVREPLHQQQLDALQLLWMREALDKLSHPHTIVVRTHAPQIVEALRMWHELAATWNTKS